MSNLLKKARSNYKKLIFYIIFTCTTFLNLSVVNAATPLDINHSSDYAKESITILHSQNIITGDDTGNYNPKESLTRGQAITLLVKTLSLDTSILPKKSTFKDVPTNHWAFNYVETAYRQGIINGISENEFGINSLCTREQVTVMFIRVLGLKKENIEGKQSLSYIKKFSDKAAISDWANDYVEFCVYTGLLQGVSKTEFDPKGYATKEQLAVIIDKFIKEFKDLKETAYNYEVATTPNISSSAYSDHFYVSFSDDFYFADIYSIYDSKGIRLSKRGSSKPNSYLPGDKKSFEKLYNTAEEGETYTIKTSFIINNKYGKKTIYNTKQMTKSKEQTVLSITPRSTSEINVYFPRRRHINAESAKNMNNYTILDESGNQINIEKIEFHDSYNYSILTLEKPLTDKTKLTVAVENVQTTNASSPEKEYVSIKPYSANILMGDKNEFIKDLKSIKYNNDILENVNSLENIKTKEIKVIMNGDTIPLISNPIVENGEILVPLELLLEMGVDGFYNPNTDIVSVGRGAAYPVHSFKNILLKINHDFAFLNYSGNIRPFDNIDNNKDLQLSLRTSPKKINNVVYLPLGFISKIIDSPIYIDDKNAIIYLRENQQNYPMLYKTLQKDFNNKRRGQFSLNTEFNNLDPTTGENINHESLTMNGVINDYDIHFNSQHVQKSKDTNFDYSREIMSDKNNIYEKDPKTGDYKALVVKEIKELDLLYNPKIINKQFDNKHYSTKLTKLLYLNYDRLSFKRIGTVKINDVDTVKYTLDVSDWTIRNVDEGFSSFLRNYSFSDDPSNQFSFFSPHNYSIEIYINDKSQIVKEVIKTNYYSFSQNLYKDFIFEIIFYGIDFPPKVNFIS